MDEWESFDYNTKRSQRKSARKTFNGVLAGILIGGVVGASGTGVYLNNQMDKKINEAMQQQQTIFETQLDNLKYQIPSNDGQTPTIVEKSSYSSNVQSVAETVMPAVVGVRTIEEREIPSFFFSSGGTHEVEGVGTGVIVSEDGLILTNQHVVSSNPKSVTVTLMDGSEYDATVIYANEIMDLAVIKINETGLPVVELGDSNAISVGEVSIAIGNPLGLEYERSVTAGIVSALDRSIQLSQYNMATNLIQTDAAINQGNSGGPLLNGAGQVIGINTYKLSSGEGMGFAIPINVAKPIIEQVKRTGEFRQAKLGASFIDTQTYALLTEDEKQQMGIELDNGLYVYEVDKQSDAYKKGVRDGDVITHADGKEVNTLLDLRTVIHNHLPGENIELTVIQNGHTKTIVAKLSDATKEN